MISREYDFGCFQFGQVNDSAFFELGDVLIYLEHVRSALTKRRNSTKAKLVRIGTIAIYHKYIKTWRVVNMPWIFGPIEGKLFQNLF